MKVTVQNGAVHGLSRRDVEAIIPLFPKAWSMVIEQLVLYQGRGDSIETEFYSKQRLLGLYWPPSGAVTKAEGVIELLVAMSVVVERGELPVRLSSAIRKRHESAVAALRNECVRALSENAA